MGTGWRRAFCTTISRDREKQQQEQSFHNRLPSPTPTSRSSGKLGLFSGGSNPSTPRLSSQSVATTPNLRCRTGVDDDTAIDPKLHCRTNATPKSTKKSPKSLLGSNPSSPRSPFSILRNSFRLSRNNCGVCLQSVKTGQGAAIYTAECSHSFHFPCIADHAKKQGALVCPVCNSTWRDVPLLGIHQLEQKNNEEKEEIIEPNIEEKQVPSPLFSIKPKQEKYYHPQIKQLNSKAYDDDEPLLTPKAGGKFIPIPESNEEEEEIQEFQGFFINPINSSTDESYAAGGRNSRNVEVKLMPEAAVVTVGRTHETYAIVLKVKAPSPPPLPAYDRNAAHPVDSSRRAPIDLVTVLDVSGSMSGAKLHMLKRAMRLVISSLGSADRLSIVAFSACPKRLLPLRRMTAQGQRAARRIIDRLACSQGTSVGEALRRATKVLEDRRERNPVASIILLSDGHDEKVQTNNTNRRQGSSHLSSTRFAHLEIPVQSIGGYISEPAEDAFAKCVGGLLSVVVQDLRFHLSFASGSDPGEISAVYSCNGRPTVFNPSSIRLGDLYAEEERELLIEIKVPPSVTGSHHVLWVSCSYKDPANQNLINGREQSLLVPRPQAVRSSSSKIERLRNHFITTRAIAESRRLIDHNELSSAYRLLSSTRALLIESSSVSADECIRGLEAELTNLQWRRQYQQQVEQLEMIQRWKTSERDGGVMMDENGEPLTPTSAWRAAEKLAKVAMMKKSLNRVGDLHGFENARF